MAYEAFQLNLKLTEIGYQQIFHGAGSNVNIKYIAVGTGLNNKGYAVAFRDTATALKSESLRKQIDASQITETTDPDTGNPCKRVDYAAILSSNASVDVREVGFFDEAERLIYIWSSPGSVVYAPIRPKLSLVVSIAQYLLIQEEMAVINVVDAGYPMELFIQPLKDQMAIDAGAIKQQLIDEAYDGVYKRFITEIVTMFAAQGAATVSIMQQKLQIIALQDRAAAAESKSALESSRLNAAIAATEQRGIDAIGFASQRFESEIAGVGDVSAATFAAIGSLSLSMIKFKLEQLNANAN